jgi:clan AA aspartic protease
MFGDSIIGYVRVIGVIANPFNRDLRVEVEFVADTGAIYTMIPGHIAEKLDLKVVDKRKFKVASGEVTEYPVSEAYIIIEGMGVTSLVVIGSEKTPPILGVTTLELLGFQVDPVTGMLKPLELMLL